MATSWTISTHDRDILRRLAARKADIANSPANLERRNAWYLHDAGDPGRRPLVLAEYAGIRDTLRPIPEETHTCQGDYARSLERALRAEIYQFDTLQDDHVVEPWINIGWHVTTTNYGVEPVMHHPDETDRMGSRRWDPPITDLDRDFHLLRPREFSVNRDSTMDELDAVTAIFSGILPVRIRRAHWWTLGMTIRAIDLIGLEPLMMVMFDNPTGLHRLMQFLHDDHLAFATWLEQEHLLCLNNENDYIGSGSMGYTRDLPASSDGHIRMADQWALLESQETVGVGPKQFAEFIFPYQASLASHFGKVYYGCCEPVHSRWHILKQLPNLARVSISPWADQTIMADACADKIAFSRKQNPTLISTENFDEAAILADLQLTLDAAAGGRLEIIMKDVHTLNNDPTRLPRWVALARQAIDEHATAHA